MDKHDKEVIAKLEDVVRLAFELQQPVFVGAEAFDCCVKGFNEEVETDEFCEYIVVADIRIILCEELEPKLFFTCPMIDFPLSTKPKQLH